MVKRPTRRTWGLAGRLGAATSVLILAATVGASSGLSARQAEGEAVVYLVRHAERADDDPRDPSLSEEGRARADQLAHVLGDAGITRMLSTDFRRTRETMQPLASRLGLAVELYDPNDLTAIAEAMLSTPGRYLVSGHSNTTPALVEALGGEPGSAIDDESEFDRLYVVVIRSGAPATTILLRYGR